MTKQRRALTKQMERLIETALTPGRFVSYNASLSFVRDLEAATRTEKLDLRLMTRSATRGGKQLRLRRNVG